MEEKDISEQTPYSGTAREETVSVPKSFFDDIQKLVKSQQKDIEFLKAIADKKSVALWHSRHREQVPPIVQIRVMDIFDEKENKTVEKVVVGWKKTKDEVAYDAVRRIGYEDQRTMLIFQDGTSQEMQIVDFERAYRKVQCQRTGLVTHEDTGQLVFKLTRMDNGESLEISDTFVN